MNKDSIHLIVAAFPELHGAEGAFAKINVAKRIKGVKAAVILQKDHNGQLHTRDIGLTPGKGAAGGVVLGAAVGVLTGGAGLALGALGGVLGGHKVKKTRESHLASDLVKHLEDALAPGYSWRSSRQRLTSKVNLRHWALTCSLPKSQPRRWARWNPTVISLMRPCWTN